jgi:hypothetical protein
MEERKIKLAPVNRKFILKDGTSIEVFFHIGKKRWGAEFYIEENKEWGQSFANTRGAAIRGLRRMIAAARDPNFKWADERIQGKHRQ